MFILQPVIKEESPLPLPCLDFIYDFLLPSLDTHIFLASFIFTAFSQISIALEEKKNDEELLVCKALWLVLGEMKHESDIEEGQQRYKGEGAM